MEKLLPWANNLWYLVQGACVVITFALITFRMLGREGLMQHPYNISGILLFGLFCIFAVYGTHAGMIISREDPPTPMPAVFVGTLDQDAAILNFRDMAVVTAGLLMGPWVGLGVGAVAGFERYGLGGFTALACGLATVLVGLFSGVARDRARSVITPQYAALVASIAVLLQKLLILGLTEPMVGLGELPDHAFQIFSFREQILWIREPSDNAVDLIKITSMPMLLINVGGCLLFISVIRSFDSERREKLAYFKAQIEPHFLTNTLNAIRSLIRIDPDRARIYVTSFGQFMGQTQRYATEYTATIREELDQLWRYVELQQLRFPDKISVYTDISKDFPLDYEIPPRTLLTLLENSLTHARNHSRPLTAQIRLYCANQQNILEVEDDGTGIDPGKLKQLGKKPVHSTHRGGGRAIYNLVQMLRLSYGADATILIENKEKQGALVRLSLPWKPKKINEW